MSTPVLCNMSPTTPDQSVDQTTLQFASSPDGAPGLLDLTETAWVFDSQAGATSWLGQLSAAAGACDHWVFPDGSATGEISPSPVSTADSLAFGVQIYAGNPPQMGQGNYAVAAVEVGNVVVVLAGQVVFADSPQPVLQYLQSTTQTAIAPLV